MIYIASPYTHERRDIRNLRYRQVLHYTQLCMAKGEIVFSPVVYGHPFALDDSRAIYFNFWKPFNEQLILASEKVRVLRLAGYLTSRGVVGEAQFALEHGIPVEQVDFPL